jgi:hypothetical protein
VLDCTIIYSINYPQYATIVMYITLLAPLSLVMMDDILISYPNGFGNCNYYLQAAHTAVTLFVLELRGDGWVTR